MEITNKVKVKEEEVVKGNVTIGTADKSETSNQESLAKRAAASEILEKVDSFKNVSVESIRDIIESKLEAMLEISKCNSDFEIITNRVADQVKTFTETPSKIAANRIIVSYKKLLDILEGIIYKNPITIPNKTHEETARIIDALKLIRKDIELGKDKIEKALELFK